MCTVNSISKDMWEKMADEVQAQQPHHHQQQQPSDMDDSLDASLIFDSKRDDVEKPSAAENDHGSSVFIFRAINSLVSKPGNRSRTSTEDSMFSLQQQEQEQEQGDNESSTETAPPAEIISKSTTTEHHHHQQQQEGSIITRIISRQPVTSLDSSASRIVRQCLEENKDNQSILYKWTAANITPTVTYMGRKFQADDNAVPNHNTKGATPRTSAGSSLAAGVEEQHHTSFVARMGLSWSSNTDHTSSDDDESESPEEYKEYLREMSDSDFRKLKAALKRKGVKTNLCLDLLYEVAKKPCSLPEQRRSRNKSMDELPTIPQSPWERALPRDGDYHHHDHHHGDITTKDAGEEEDDMPKLIIISRCA